MSKLLLTLNDFAEILPKVFVSFSDGTRPDPRRNYQNATRFAAENEGYQLVSGWLIIGSCIFQKHHVVRNLQGHLIEITPEADPLPFVPHYPRTGVYSEMSAEIFLLESGEMP